MARRCVLRSVLALFVFVLAGCEPPPQPRLPASIRILYPSADRTTVALDDDGMLRLLVVVDIDDYDLVPPSGGLEPVPGQGHWHLYLNADFYPAPGFERAVETDKYGPDDAIDVVVQLTSNDHADLVEPDCDPCSDRLELEVVAAGS